MKKILITLFLIFNAMLILFAAVFFSSNFSLDKLLNFGAVILAGGILGLIILVALTHGLKVITKVIFIAIILIICLVGAYNYFSKIEPVEKRYFAVVVNENLNFTEYWFSNSNDLSGFLLGVRWHADDAQRRQVFDYYKVTKSGEKETGKHLIRKAYIEYFAGQQPAGELVAYVNEEGKELKGISLFMHVFGEPKYVISPSGKTYPSES